MVTVLTAHRDIGITPTNKRHNKPCHPTGVSQPVPAQPLIQPRPRMHFNVRVKTMKPEEINCRKEAYQRILSLGLVAIRDRVRTLPSVKVVEIEADHLHNIPSLIEEPNERRHIYYALKERDLYLQRIREFADKDYLDQVVSHYQGPWEVLLKFAIAAQEAINEELEQVGGCDGEKPPS